MSYIGTIFCILQFPPSKLKVLSQTWVGLSFDAFPYIDGDTLTDPPTFYKFFIKVSIEVTVDDSFHRYGLIKEAQCGDHRVHHGRQSTTHEEVTMIIYPRTVKAY